MTDNPYQSPEAPPEAPSKKRPPPSPNGLRRNWPLYAWYGGLVLPCLTTLTTNAIPIVRAFQRGRLVEWSAEHDVMQPPVVVAFALAGILLGAAVTFSRANFLTKGFNVVLSLIVAYLINMAGLAVVATVAMLF
ncbi:hypothetical protein [Lignipirellula cremea]|uniref:Uncharacterized protein n=1 Tax=Lignipirellula cremea TaxID=2528010 RepID=A0A518E2U8_9BACT|nr:hypothetical protein [Lignipirellula cremea]QDU98415.1 hypothetical protein Pla8534_62830 [Lignipirellula cremea]